MTIYDIAREAGVSKSTVSRVLNGEKVGENTKDKVLEIIKKYNYVPNQKARSLSKNSKKSILVLMTRIDSYAEEQALKGIIKNSDNFDFMIFESEFDIQKSEEIIGKHKEVVGRIIFAIGNESYNFLEDDIIPTVMIGQKFETYNCIYYNDTKAMNLLCEEIRKYNNVNNILYLGIDNNDDPTVGKVRYNEMKNFCTKYNIKLENIKTTYKAKESYNQVETLNLNKYDVIVGATDRIILGVYKVLLKQGIHNKILGSIGNNQNLNFIIDNLITVDLNYEISGEKAMQILIAKQNNKKIKCDVNLIKINMED